MSKIKTYYIAIYVASIYLSINTTILSRYQKACKLNLLCFITFSILLLVYILFFILAWRQYLFAKFVSIFEISFFSQDLQNLETKKTSIKNRLAIKIN